MKLHLHRRTSKSQPKTAIPYSRHLPTNCHDRGNDGLHTRETQYMCFVPARPTHYEPMPEEMPRATTRTNTSREFCTQAHILPTIADTLPPQLQFAIGWETEIRQQATAACDELSWAGRLTKRPLAMAFQAETPRAHCNNLVPCGHENGTTRNRYRWI